MKKLVIGILAHVDAGKTTLSESMLFLSGEINELGRVDKKDAYLDTHALERERGITIFSKQALFTVEDSQITLLDTPGHVDFSPEMERTLQVLDYAILVISGADGVQGHTKTLWRLLDMYQTPTFIFVNKMDQAGTDQALLLAELQRELAENCLAFDQVETEQLFEELALCSETLMETYLETGQVKDQDLQEAVLKRQVFPCFFGSALKLIGVETFLQGLNRLTQAPTYPKEFGAEIFKISRDEQGNRLTHLKIVGGSFKVRDLLETASWQEKVNEIRIYSGDKYEVVPEIQAGSVCAVTGLTEARPGESLGIGTGSQDTILEPVLAYQVLLPEGIDPKVMLPKLRQIEEEEPELRIVWQEELQEIQAQIMGEVQIEILQSLIASRFGVEVQFSTGKILYKETIAEAVEGVGHFEPLRHYAEVVLLLEPASRGSGLHFATDCSEDLLAKNWQRLILSHLQEKTHLGVLTGSAITDLNITLIAGRAHNNHTVGGDFREATYRAVRQGLKEAQSILLEPYYRYQLEVPESMIGRAMTDLEKMHGSCEITGKRGDNVLLTGSAPVVTLRNYQREVLAYTRGLGQLFCSLEGYKPCHNSEEVLAQIGYDSERDDANPTGSIFCKQGTGFYVRWDRVKEEMHLNDHLQFKRPEAEGRELIYRSPTLDKIDYELLERTTSGNRGKKRSWSKRRKKEPQKHEQGVLVQPKKEYLLVDGYNIIHAWPELEEFASENMDLARVKLLDTLADYQSVKQSQIIVVFDAYSIERQQEEVYNYLNLHVVFTKEAQTADAYIEKFAYDHQEKYRITVATSDALQQIIIRGAGCSLLSARELKEDVTRVKEIITRDFFRKHRVEKISLDELLSPDVHDQINDLKNEHNNKGANLDDKKTRN